MIKNLIFDFGGVLVDYDFGTVIDTFPFNSEEDKRQFKEIVLSREFVDACDLEMIPFEEMCRNKQQEYPHLATCFQTFYDRYMEFVTEEKPGMTELLQQLKAEGFHLYGLTNWNSMVHKVILRYPIFRLLEDQIISSDEHLIKPDKAIYLRLLEKFHLKAEDCVFADDKLPNVEGARNCGITSILFKTPQQYEQELRALLQTK